ncbi:DUF2339 domain-containing protein [Hoeflea sp.]|uniref:DUF2339 domain-containing protein n=1 Tax=Hoeflea sp. TaxID=1940281 RepID=UPI003A8F01D4
MFGLFGFIVLVALVLWVRTLQVDQRRMAEEIALLRRDLNQLGNNAPDETDADAGAAQGDASLPPEEISVEDQAADTGDGGEPDNEADTSDAADEPIVEPVAARAAALAADTSVSSVAGSRKSVDLEGLIGGRWSALLGGLAIALGVLFLARYSIEAGLLGPRARTAMGALMSVGLFAAGEVMRRRDRRDALPMLMTADIPGILTGAAAIGAFGTLYAAYALYGFIGPAIAFVGLTVVGIASLLLSAVHGPKLAAIGLVGAYAAPLLVSSDTPDPVAFGLHILVVTAAVMGVARIRGWLWLAIGGIVGSTLLTPLLLTIGTDVAGVMLGVLLLLLFGVHLGSLVVGVSDRPKPLADRPALWIAFAATLEIVLIAVVAAWTGGAHFPVLAAIPVLAAVLMAAAGTWPALSLVAPVSAALVVLTQISLRVDFPILTGMTTGIDLRDGMIAPDIAGFARDGLLLAVPSFALAVWFGLRAAPMAPKMAGRLALAATIIGVLAMTAFYLVVAPFETHVATGLAALALAAVIVALTEIFTRARPDDWSAPAPAWLAVGAVALTGLAIGILLTRQWMPLGFAVTVAGACMVYRVRPVPALGWLSVVLALLATSGLLFNAPFAADQIGITPIFNKLILITGVPAVLLIWGGIALRAAGGRRPGELVIAFGLSLLALFVALELRHLLAGGDILGAPFGLIDMATQSIAALGFSIGLQLAARRGNADVFGFASLVAGAIGIVAMALGLVLAFNPFLAGDPVGEGHVFNLLLPGYLVTGLLAVLTAYMSPPTRPRWYRYGYGGVGAVLLFIYATLMTRHGFQGGDVRFFRATSDAEIWSYSVVWLAMGGGVLALGLMLKSVPLRAASAAIILLTVAKVFLIDMSALTGVLRAFSFIGLGGSLLVIGRFYQRILQRTGNRPA